MMPFGIPAWNANGVLPPVDVENPLSFDRSPYVVRLSEVVQRFGSTVQRRAILEGLLEYRAALHAAGLTEGFQWLDGSFLENVEVIRERPPNDIDVVTFFRVPDGESEESIELRAPMLFEPRMIKQQFHVDGYLENLDLPSEGIIERAIYWYGTWSHRRDAVWKGYLQVDLAPEEDFEARTVLMSLAASELRA